MRTLLTLDRIKDGTLLERRRSWSRSFTRGLWDLLYIAHAQLLAASPYPCVDIIGAEKEIDSESQANRARYYKSTLRIAAERITFTKEALGFSAFSQEALSKPHTGCCQERHHPQTITQY